MDRSDVDEGRKEGLRSDERAELVRRRRENRVQAMEIEILKRASATGLRGVLSLSGKQGFSVPPGQSEGCRTRGLHGLAVDEAVEDVRAEGHPR
jgi:hypothetical protein